jgi:hypothetical protein
MNEVLQLARLDSAIFSAFLIIAVLIFSGISLGLTNSVNGTTKGFAIPELSDIPLSADTEPDLSSLFPQLNSSEFPGIEDDSNTTSTSGISAVSGTYVNDRVGFQINLPDGWSGQEIKFLVNMALVSPEGFKLSDKRPETFMTVSGIDAAAFDFITSIAEQALEGGSIQELYQLDLTGTSSSSVTCKKLSSSIVTINGINAEELAQECTDGELQAKGKGYIFGTQDNSLIAIGYYGTSSTYDQYLPQFEDSVKTIKISKPGDISKSETFAKFKDLEAKLTQSLQTG